MKTIWFDMDGTIANLYGVKNWLTYLRNCDVHPYAVAKPIYEISYLEIVIKKLKDMGYDIGIISYVAHNSTPEYAEAIARTKRNWLAHHFPFANPEKIHITTKDIAKNTYYESGDILVDDEQANLDNWSGDTINANKNIIWELYKLTERN